MITNETIKNIMERYSCREYSNDPVTDEELETVLEAGKYAPNAKNNQAWHFTVIKTSEGREKVLSSIGPKPDDPMLGDLPWPPDADYRGAPLMILVSGDESARFVEDGVFIAAGYMMLAAQSIGLGTVWSTSFSKYLFRDDESRRYKNEIMPEGYRPYVAFFLGHPADPKATQQKPRKDNVSRYL